MVPATLLEDDEKRREAEEDKAPKDAMDHAWAWFKYHAEQRVAMIRFYIVSLGGVAAGVGILNQQQQHLLCACLSLLAALMSFCFLRIDKRTSHLVKCGEAAMRPEESRLAELRGNDAIKICNAAERRQGNWPYTYTEVFRLLFRVTTGVFAAMAVYSVASSQHMLMLIHATFVGGQLTHMAM